MILWQSRWGNWGLSLHRQYLILWIQAPLCVCYVASVVLTLCDAMDCSLPGSTVQEILQARILECVAISFSRGSFQPRDGTHISCTTGRFFTTSAKNYPECFRSVVSINSHCIPSVINGTYYGPGLFLQLFLQHTLEQVVAAWQRMDAFELWCWKRLLRVPWTARRSNQSILKEISPGCSLEGLMLKLKL